MLRNFHRQLFLFRCHGKPECILQSNIVTGVTCSAVGSQTNLLQVRYKCMHSKFSFKPSITRGIVAKNHTYNTECPLQRTHGLEI